ncbi:MAG: hypothetical protein RL033_1004 [Pseudomonadota bacterium]
MEKHADQDNRDHAPAVRLGRSYVRAPQFAASAVLILAAALSACGDDAKPAVMQETSGATPAPSSNTPPTTAAPTTPEPPAPQTPAPPANPTPSSNEGQGNGMIPVMAGSMPSQGGSMQPSAMPPAPPVPPAGTGGSGAQPTPPVPPMQPQQPAAFNPCPTDGSPCKIMPLGDSITDGVGSQAGGGGGYRVELFRQAVADGHDITFVGTRPANGPNMVAGQTFPRNHEGLSGDSIQGTANRAATAVPSTTPDIILLHIGTNNLGGNGVPQEVPGQLASLVDQIIEDAPDALLVVAQLIPTTQAQRTQNTQAYNATIPALVQSRAAQGKHVVLVDMFDAFTNNPGGVNPLMNDFLHPNVAGYVVMAQTWYDAIESVLPGD